jgi:hypothetical protein
MGQGSAFVLAPGGHNQDRAVRPPLCDRRHDEPSSSDSGSRAPKNRFCRSSRRFRRSLSRPISNRRIPVSGEIACSIAFVSHVEGYKPPQNNIMQAPPTPDEFKGAAGMHSFTAVYFNRAHTLAMTEIGMFCGGLCGNWRWVVLERKDGQWQTLPWVTMSMVS